MSEEAYVKGGGADSLNLAVMRGCNVMIHYIVMVATENEKQNFLTFT